MKKSCLNCIKSGVCKIYHGEMLHRDYWHKDFIKELNKLETELGKECKEYRRKECPKN